MKRTIASVAFCAIAVVAWASAYAGPLNILSSNYHVSGDFGISLSAMSGEHWDYVSSVEGSSANAPFSIRIGGDILSGLNFPVPIPYTLGAQSYTSIDVLSFTSEAHAPPDLCEDANGLDGRWTTYANTTAEASWVFRPAGSLLSVDLTYSEFSNYLNDVSTFSVSLIDKTLSLNLIDFSVPYTNGFSEGRSYEFSVDPTHDYEFMISADTRSFDSTYLTLLLKAQIESVPIPEPSTELLFLTGLLGLFGLKRRLQG